MSSASFEIRRARTQAGMTQAELAARAGLTQSAVARLERPGSNPTLATLARVIAGTGHRLVLSAHPASASFDEGQLRERLAMTPAQRLANFTASSRNLDRMARRARRVVADRAPLDAEQILRRLIKRGVDFVVIGGIAAVLHGSARNTFDLDICFSTDDANVAALGDVLIALSARLRGVDEDLPFVPDGRIWRGIELLTLVTCLGELHVLARPPGAPPYQQLRRNADRYDVGGFDVPVASIDDLIAMKQASGRAKDLLDIEELEGIKRLRRRL
jgi:transcriptional regulator with XRE-family HTH domain